jgi:hypothetical protein
MANNYYYEEVGMQELGDICRGVYRINADCTKRSSEKPPAFGRHVRGTFGQSVQTC